MSATSKLEDLIDRAQRELRQHVQAGASGSARYDAGGEVEITLTELKLGIDDDGNFRFGGGLSGPAGPVSGEVEGGVSAESSFELDAGNGTYRVKLWAEYKHVRET